jgi:hypothetical protein
VALVRTDVSEECRAFIISVTRIGELGTLAVTSTDARCEEILCEKGSISMEYQIEDAERSGGVCKQPDYKARFQTSVEGVGGGVVYKDFFGNGPTTPGMS